MAEGPAGDAAMLYISDGSGRVLLVRARGLLDGHWMPPGGHLDPDESAADAVCREVVEELGLLCDPGDLELLGECSKDLGTGVLTLFATNRHAGTVQLGPEILECRWVELDACEELPTLPATDHGLRLLTERRC